MAESTTVDLFWREWQRVREGSSGSPDPDQAGTSAWERAAARDWTTDADR